MIDIDIFLIDEDLPFPEYKTEGSLGFDLASREDVMIPPFGSVRIPLNIIVKVPKRYGLFLLPRSSLFSKTGLIVTNSIGLIDLDFCGEEDEVKLSVFNTRNDFTIVERGKYIAQGVILPVPETRLNQAYTVSFLSRGGFGSTDEK